VCPRSKSKEVEECEGAAVPREPCENVLWHDEHGYSRGSLMKTMLLVTVWAVTRQRLSNRIAGLCRLTSHNTSPGSLQFGQLSVLGHHLEHTCDATTTKMRPSIKERRSNRRQRTAASSKHPDTTATLHQTFLARTRNWHSRWQQDIAAPNCIYSWQTPCHRQRHGTNIVQETARL
jgi:hypothetical protein